MTRTSRLGTLRHFAETDEDKIQDGILLLNELRNNKYKWIVDLESLYILVSDVVSNPRGAVKDNLRNRITGALLQLESFLEDQEKLPK